MRNAETVLSIIRERGKQGLPLEDIYRQLYNPDLYLRAYSRIYSNKGAMTPGSTQETVDGMSLAKIEQLIEELRYERYQWKPVRRTYIAKKNGKKRPLGLPTWSDKLLQEVIRSILEAYYEPQFSSRSHGFRPNRGCHSALQNITSFWVGTKWFIEGDISSYFDTINHEILVSILKEKLKDNRFLRLIENLLKAGYLEDWKYYPSLSGTPQGGIVSPILANIYLDKFDKYVEQILLPQCTNGKRRKRSQAYENLRRRAIRWQKKGQAKQAQHFRAQSQKLPSTDPYQADYRRLRYVRYADDFLLGFIGPKSEAEEIKVKIRDWLKENLKLELSEDKTLITHAPTEPAHFLGYELVAQQANEKHDHNGRRSINGIIGLRISAAVVEAKCAKFTENGKPARLGKMIRDSDYTIIDTYQAQYRGIVQYYILANNVSWFHRLFYVMQSSLLRTLACKHKSTLKAMHKKYRTVLYTPFGPLKGLEVVVERGEGRKPLKAQFGGIPLRRENPAIPHAFTPDDPYRQSNQRKEIIQKLLADECQLCGAKEKVEIHHIRKLSDLNKYGRRAKPKWVERMAARQRKTLAVCPSCHNKITFGKL